MGHGLAQVFTLSIASNVTVTSAYDLGRAFSRVYLEVPTMTSGTDIFIQAGMSSTANFRRVMFEPANSLAVQNNTFTIASASSQRLVPIPPGFRYYKVELSTAMTATSAILNIHCAD